LPLCAAGDDPASFAIIPASLPATTRNQPPARGRKRQAGQSKFKTYPTGYFHIDIAEVRTEDGKLHLFVAIDRTSKFAVVELHEKATTRVAADFLRALIKAVPYKVHTILTDNGIHFTASKGRRNSNAVP
jgi:IS30 family transposase